VQLVPSDPGKPSVFELQGSVYRHYADWCRGVGHRPLGRNSCYEELDAMGGAAGVIRKRLAEGGVIAGLQLRGGL
jgi:hypothetical protein